MKVLVLHTGSLGDTLIALPALRAVREHFKNAHITLLSDYQSNSTVVKPVHILGNSIFVDSFLTYKATDLPIYLKLREVLRVALYLKEQKYDALVYLIRTGRSYPKIIRDLLFFRFAGIRHVYGHKYASKLLPSRKRKPLPIVRHETDNLLFRLEACGIRTKPSFPRIHEWVSQEDFSRANRWFLSLPPAGGKPWVAIGPGSKMPSKLWPYERYFEVVKRLIENFDIWPVVFGGAEDKPLGEKLIKQWGRGYVAAGYLSVREGIVALSKCVFYLGNDTGTMHMAVVAGIPCVAIFSARDFPGLWYPYGEGHIVLRKRVECEGCMLETCVYEKNRCLLSISSQEVYDACVKMLNLRSQYLDRLAKTEFKT